LTITAAAPGSYVLDVHLHTTSGRTLPDVVLDVDVTG